MASDKTTRATATASGSVAVLEITGDVTDGSEQAILAAYRQLHSRNIRKLLLKFHPASFMNSAGIRVIIALTFEAESRRQSIRVTGLSPHMQEIFGLMGLTNHLKIFGSEQDALKGWK